MAEQTVIAYVHADNGTLAGRVVMEDDHDAPCAYEGPHEYFPALTDGRVVIRTVWANRNTCAEWYEAGDGGQLDAAWERIREGENAEGVGQYIRTDDEDVELFTRYLRVFHPTVAVRESWVTTGYSQGDTVRLIGWSEVARATYLEAAADHELIGQAFDFIGEFARGQFVSIAYESAELEDVTVDGDGLTARVEWTEEDRIGGVHYSEEFSPAPEALRVAAHDLEIPGGCTITAVEG